jgi:hypothetical protein
MTWDISSQEVAFHSQTNYHPTIINRYKNIVYKIVTLDNKKENKPLPDFPENE